MSNAAKNAAGGPELPEALRLITFDCFKELVEATLGMRSVPPLPGLSPIYEFMAIIGHHRHVLEVPRAAITLAKEGPEVVCAASLAEVLRSVIAEVYVSAVKESISMWLEFNCDEPGLADRCRKSEWAYIDERGVVRDVTGRDLASADADPASGD